MNQQHNPMQQDETQPIRGRVSTKGSFVDDNEDEDVEELQIDISYLCKLFAGDPPRLVGLGECMLQVRRSTQCHLEKV